MKTAPRLISFSWLLASVLLAFLPGARAIEAGLMGMAQKDGAAYIELAKAVREKFEKIEVPFLVVNQVARSAAHFRSDFTRFCLDEDSADVVSWQSSHDGLSKVSFSCVLASEELKLHERLFVFYFESGELLDVQIASADLVSSSTNMQMKVSATRNSFEQVVIAVSGAMLSGGFTAVRAQSGAVAEAESISQLRATGQARATETRILASRHVGSSAVVAGLGAAVSHFIFNMASSTSWLAGGALTVALSDINETAVDPVTGQPRRKAQRNGVGPIPVRMQITFKF